MTGKREALIDAAKDLLWERGYEAMSPKAVLKASGAGQGSLYHHFEGKRDLAATALQETEAQMRETYARYFDPDLPPMKRIETYINAPREALKGCKFGRLSNEQAISDPVLNPIVEGFFDHIEGLIAQAAREAQQDGDLPKSLKPKDFARMLIATLQGGYVMSRIHQDPAPMKQARDTLKILLKAAAD